jgi:hypothetical protein
MGLDGAELYLCLHRVGYSSSREVVETSITPEKLDALLELLTGGSFVSRAKRIVASFDDGYADAVDYVLSRYERFPTVDWMFFVCPAKTRDRVGFRWDAADPDAEKSMPLSVEQENRRASLKALGDAPSHRLATVEELKRVASLPRVTLGNHTNCHFALSMIPIEEARREFAQSKSDFDAIFGPSEHFAFPHGVPGKHFNSEHEELAFSCGYRYLYTTMPRPVRHLRGSRGQQISRFAVFGTWPVKKVALLIALISIRERFRS